jgi:DNA helicase-2/ATP-dependent DNA helicase PcrA
LIAIAETKNKLLFPKIMAYPKKSYAPREVKRIPFQMTYTPSEFQQAIFDSWIGKRESLHAEAVAGSGKSTTIVAAAHLDPDKSPAAYLSFNSDIVKEIEPRMPEHVTVKTAHGFGLRAVMNHFRVRNGLEAGKNKVLAFLREYNTIADRNDPNAYERMQAVKDLIDKMRLNLIYPTDSNGIDAVMDTYQIDIDCIDYVKSVLPEIFDKIIDTGKAGVVDFVDMLWLPVHLDLPIQQFDRMFIDECQDFSSLMQKFAFKMAGGKVMTVGDRNQSIYGFAGADTQAVDRLVKLFGSRELPLSVCYRCHEAAILEAQKIVPHIKPREGAPMGELRIYGPDMEWSMIPRENTMVLCRRNAPLVGPVFKLLKMGVKATIKGRDVGKGLIKLIDSLKGDQISMEKGMPSFLDKLEEYRLAKVQAIMLRKNPNPAAIDAINDNCEALENFCDGQENTMGVKFKINQVFEQEGGVVFSTIHRSKGLEEDNVYILDRTNVRIKNPMMTQEQSKQEANLEYVAITRPKKILGYIG